MGEGIGEALSVGHCVILADLASLMSHRVHFLPDLGHQSREQSKGQGKSPVSRCFAPEDLL